MPYSKKVKSISFKNKDKDKETKTIAVPSNFVLDFLPLLSRRKNNGSVRSREDETKVSLFTN